MNQLYIYIMYPGYKCPVRYVTQDGGEDIEGEGKELSRWGKQHVQRPRGSLTARSEHRLQTFCLG